MKNGLFTAVAVLLVLGLGGCQDGQSLFSPIKQKQQPVAEQPAPQAEPEADTPQVAQSEEAIEPEVDGSTADAVRKFIEDLEQANSPDQQDDTVIVDATPVQYGPGVSSRQAARANGSIEIPPTHEISESSDPQPAAPKILAVSLTGDTTLEVEPKPAASIGVHQGLDTAEGTDRVSLERLIEQAKADLETKPEDAQKQWQLSLLQLAAGQSSEAANLSSALTPEARQLTSHIVKTAMNASRLLADPLSGADETLASVDAFRASLRADAELLVPVVALCASVTTFGVYDELPPNAMQPYQANRAIVYCEIDNFTVEETEDDTFRALLATRIELFTDDGRSVWTHEEERIEDNARQMREDFFLAQLVTFPTDLGPGDYVLKVAVTDALSSKTNEGVHRFHIGGIGATTSAAP